MTLWVWVLFDHPASGARFYLCSSYSSWIISSLDAATLAIRPATWSKRIFFFFKDIFHFKLTLNPSQTTLDCKCINTIFPQTLEDMTQMVLPLVQQLILTTSVLTWVTEVLVWFTWRCFLNRNRKHPPVTQKRGIAHTYYTHVHTQTPVHTHRLHMFTHTAEQPIHAAATTVSIKGKKLSEKCLCFVALLPNCFLNYPPWRGRCQLCQHTHQFLYLSENKLPVSDL